MIGVLHRDVLNALMMNLHLTLKGKRKTPLSPRQGFSVFTVLKDT